MAKSIRDRSSPRQRMMWQAIRNSRRFIVNEIVLLSGANRSYVKRYLSFLKKEGYVVDAGKVGCQNYYRITDKATPDVPVYSRRRNNADKD